MPSKRFLSTAAPLAFIALAGMGLATAQSSSPFASKQSAQAWETPSQAWNTPAAQPAYTAPPAYSAPQSYAPQPSFAPRASAPKTSYAVPPVPASADAPIATAPRPVRTAPVKSVMASASTSTPPKTYGGRGAAPYQAPAQAPAYAPRAGASVPPSGSNYVYTPPRQAAPVKTAQVPDFGSPTPPTGNPATTYGSGSGSPYAPTGTPAPSYGSPSGSPYAPAGTPATGYGASSSSSSVTTSQTWGEYERTRPAQSTYQGQTQTQPQYQNQYPAQPAARSSGGAQAQGGTAYPPSQGYQGQGYQEQQYPGYQNSVPPTGVPPTGAPYPGGPYSGGPQQPRSWKDKLGLGSIATLLRGAFTVGAAATNRDQPENQLGPDDGWNEDFIGDADLEFEASAITQGGLEYGVNLGARAQYDRYRRGFGGQLPECPPTAAGCSGNAAALTTGLRGHSSGFYSGGEDITKDAQFALESAHIFLRSGYGDVTIGRDDGAAYLFSLGAPTLLAVGASNSPVDYTGYDSVKTVNDASGFSEKITYTSPRLLGDQIGVGIQFGASYALDADVCGVDYCNGKNIDGVIQPEIEDVFEVGLALDRTFTNGLSAELTGTYARGSENSGFDGLDDLESFGAGLEFGYNDFTLGGSYLNSNNGLQDGDYTAYDVGITWKPNALGFTLGYGHAEDDNVGLESDQITGGITYDFDKFTLGTGVQYVDRSVNGLELGIPTTLDQKATSIFIQGGFKF